MLSKVNRKSLKIKTSGRSTDYLTPSFIFGCGFNCSYCYCKRHVHSGLTAATNVEEILTEVDHHAWFADVEKPNQTHEEYVTYDIGCNTDVALHYKHLEWDKVFDFFKQHPKAMGSFATKYVNEKLLDYDPEGKMRIRFSLMPQKYADVLEPNTSSIVERINAISKFQDAGWDVHVNFSPVVVTNGWLDEYKGLFELLPVNEKVKAEVIFLTHNLGRHIFNLKNNPEGEDLLWKPEIQENKVSQYGGENIRYKRDLKAHYIKQWTQLHDEIIPWNTIRYIF
jgi:spore photoproduct lyase